ncbi:cupredoxin domain-containing protein [Deinococcus multiflagellatus]|uniref:Cupredoxin domain-containing protein n=1 Tax=Deinococcus multiflagellatus TaxID=1656887 RepID=A0ABW1ZFT3_9DEIO|nr:cupredoxin domain-containing protein [Deinococcus multiflagellatus]MBZ9711816.1 cupredoxin domain-containing protein [Deinococcus multiflagellatus]
MKTVPLTLTLLSTLGTVQAASLNLTMSDLKFTPAALTLKAGQPVTLRLSNTGKVPHELQIYAKPRVAPTTEAAWDAYMKTHTLWQGAKNLRLIQNGKAVGGTFFEVVLAPGAQATLTFTPTKTGVFEMACHMPGHYEGGMKGTVTVK